MPVEFLNLFFVFFFFFFFLSREKPGTTLPSPDFNGSFLHSTAAANFSSLNLGPKPQGVSGSSTTNTEYSEMFARWKNEMHRSIKRHLEAREY